MTYCGYCQRVKQLLTQLGATFKVLELDEMSKKPTKSLSLNLDCQDAGKTVMIMGLINNFAKAHDECRIWRYVLSKISPAQSIFSTWGELLGCGKTSP
ncbi:unnamed protein product [Brassica napus]|uniref:(rape) hypothetical protein n=1 Tax=Brassica napus TaxID=3708 RepID=A0A816L6Q2_BRANA|nr:unnamed protein product [Brassica napus]